MKKILFVLVASLSLMLISCCDSKDNLVARTGLWEVYKVNDSTLIAVPTPAIGNPSQPIVFNVNDVETYNKVTKK